MSFFWRGKETNPDAKVIVATEHIQLEKDIENHPEFLFIDFSKFRKESYLDKNLKISQRNVFQTPDVLVLCVAITNTGT